MHHSGCGAGLISVSRKDPCSLFAVNHVQLDALIDRRRGQAANVGTRTFIYDRRGTSSLGINMEQYSCALPSFHAQQSA